MILFGILDSLGKKRLTIHEVTIAFRKAFPEHAQAPDVRSRVLAALRELETKGLLELPKRGWDHSGHPALPGTVRLKTAPKAAGTGRIDAWIPELSFAATAANPSRLEILRRINTFLIRRRGAPLAMVPVAERSLDIFGDEKRLQGLVDADGTLFEGRLPLEALGAYPVKPPLIHASSIAAPAGSPILIVENLATFESFRQWNLKAGAYSSIVLGNGNSLSQGHESLDDLASELGARSLFYFGDLDPPGLDILRRVNRTRSESSAVPLQPHIPLYTWLLNHGIGRPGKTKALLKHRRFVEEVFEPDTAAKILDLWASGNFVPQENYGTEQLLSDASPALPF